MATLHLKNVSIKGISACVPSHIEDNKISQLFNGKEEVKKFVDTTGIEFRHTVNGRDICTSDLCYEAAIQLMAKMDWHSADIDCLIFVSQSPDYILPATACILQGRLGLPLECYAIDISLGCSGWVYGLSVIASLMFTGTMKKGLLLAGDTATITKSQKDKSTFPLFGDAGTATAVEFSEGAEGIKFHMGTDGKGYEAIMIPDGGFRNFVTYKSFIEEEVQPGIFRNRLQSILDGPSVFIFGITKAPKSVNSVLERFNINKAEIDYYVFHQANLIMNEKIRMKLKIEPEKVPYSLGEYGNTSSASIPLTIVARLNTELSKDKKKLLVCAFGVGLSWASAVFETENLVCLPVIEI